ncbi:MAG: hypothetical protein CMJ90_18995 [Planctomycetes bacterium]|nr:hypothetical protein [Planctomycetota bacterium]
MKNRTRTRKIGEAVVTLTALPLLLVAPLLSGTFQVHQHGSWFQVHQGVCHDAAIAPTPCAADRGHHHAHHEHGHQHHVDGSSESGVPDNGGEPRDCFVVDLRRTTIATPPRSVAATRTTDWRAPAFDLRPASDCMRSPLTAHQMVHRAPPRTGVEALLLSSHALLL